MATGEHTVSTRADAALLPPRRSQQYLVFATSNVEFAVALDCVSEIVPFAEVSELLGAPPHVIGVVHVRGRVLPVIDIALKLRRPAAVRGARTCIVFVRVACEGVATLVGVVTDGIANLVEVRPDDLAPVPDIEADRLGHIVGLIATGRGTVPVLDIGQALRMEELAAFPAPSQPTPDVGCVDSCSDDRGRTP